jgi:hypothetical protein
MKENQIRCSFCNKSQTEVRRLVVAQGSGAAICS